MFHKFIPPRLRQAMPAWADITAIDEVYAWAARLTEITGYAYVVDHIVPINHPLVCGLHVPHNLRVISKQANAAKANFFEV